MYVLYPILTPARCLRVVMLNNHLHFYPCFIHVHLLLKTNQVLLCTQTLYYGVEYAAIMPFKAAFFSLVEMCAGPMLRTSTQPKLCMPELFPLSSVHSYLTVLFRCCVFWLETSTFSMFCLRHFAYAAICQRGYRSPVTGKVPISSYGSL